MRMRHNGPKTKNATDAKLQLDLAFDEYKKIKPKANEIRYIVLVDLANAEAESTGAEGAAILSQLQLREEQRRLGMKLRLLKGNNRSGISDIIAPDNDEVLQRYSEKEDDNLSSVIYYPQMNTFIFLIHSIPHINDVY